MKDRKLMLVTGINLIIFMGLIAGTGGMFNTEFDRFESPGVSPYGLTFDGVNYWNADLTSHRIYKLSPDMSVLSEFPSPASFPSGLTWDDNYLWQADVAGEIYKLDGSGEVLDSFALPDYFPEGVTFDGSHIWVVDGNAGTVNKMTEDMQVILSLPVPAPHPSGLAWNGAHLILTDTEYQWIYLLDPYTGDIVGGGNSPGFNPRGLTWDGTHIWNSDLDGIGSIFRIDRCEAGFGARIVMPSYDLKPGEIIYVDAVIWNPTGEIYSDVPLFVILEIYGEYFFAPSFSDRPDYFTVDVGLWQTAVRVLPPFYWPQDLPPGDATWYAAMTTPDLKQLFGEMGIFHFQW